MMRYLTASGTRWWDVWAGRRVLDLSPGLDSVRQNLFTLCKRHKDGGLVLVASHTLHTHFPHEQELDAFYSLSIT